MRKIIFLIGMFIPMVCLGQHTITTKDAQTLNVKLLAVGDSTITYQQKDGKKAKTRSIMLKDVESYKVKEGITYKVVLPKRDTIVEITRDTVFSFIVDGEMEDYNMTRAGNPNEMIGKALKTTGTISMSIGVPCLAAGISCLLYANLLPSATEGYTTSKTAAAQSSDLKYIMVEEYIRKMEGYNGKVKAAETAGYILTPLGGGLTIVGIPMFLYGKKIGELKVNYTGNGAGVSMNF